MREFNNGNQTISASYSQRLAISASAIIMATGLLAGCGGSVQNQEANSIASIDPAPIDNSPEIKLPVSVPSATSSPATTITPSPGQSNTIEPSTAPSPTSTSSTPELTNEAEPVYADSIVGPKKGVVYSPIDIDGYQTNDAQEVVGYSFEYIDPSDGWRFFGQMVCEQMQGVYDADGKFTDKYQMVTYTERDGTLMLSGLSDKDPGYKTVWQGHLPQGPLDPFCDDKNISLDEALKLEDPVFYHFAYRASS